MNSFLKALCGILILSASTLCAAQSLPRTDVLITGRPGPKNTMTNLVTSQGTSASVLLINKSASHEDSVELHGKVLKELLARYVKVAPKMLSTSEPGDPRVDERVTCTISLTGTMFGVDFLLECANPNKKELYTGRRHSVEKEYFDKLAKEVPGWIEDLYSKTLKIQ